MMTSLDDIGDASNVEEAQDDVSQEVLTVAEGLARGLRDLGATHAFGVCGGAQALLWAAFSRQLQVLHFRHESGAAFAATEAHFVTNRPVVVFTTTGPGITNALTGMLAARTEGAKVILVSAYASAPQRGRGGIQETSSYTMPSSGLFEAGAWFDDAVILESAEQLPQVLRRLEAGLSRPGAYVAHLTIPNAVQGATLSRPLPRPSARASLGVSRAAIAHCVGLLSGEPFVIWAGFGARGAAPGLLALAERAGAAVMCSPRAKGIFPEDHPLFIGVTGMGGHTAAAVAHLRQHKPRRILVLGTRLGEPTSFWNPALIPPGGFIHVDIDPDVPGLSYPDAQTYGVQADIGDFLADLLAAWPGAGAPAAYPEIVAPHPLQPAPQEGGRVRPAVLMGAIQRSIIDQSDAVVLAESGNSFTWATSYLRFATPNRYRVSTNLGSMGHAAAGALGAAIDGRRAVAILGDGAMLMNSEVNTAVKRQLPVLWIVLNDGRYNMCFQGMAALGMGGLADALFPAVDFAMLARAMGADGVRVDSEDGLQAALTQALAATGPFVLDVIIDPDQLAPTRGRNEGLRAASSARAAEGLSFPVIAAN